MKTRLFKVTLICCTAIAIQSCTKEKKSDISDLKWFIGKWESKTEEGILYEEWNKVNDSTIAGHAFAISTDGDTTFSENAKIIDRNGVIVYSVTVNNEQTTDFTLVDNEKQAVFENIYHDYPQRIIYKKMGNDSLFARIEGSADGADAFEEFRYGKSK